MRTNQISFHNPSAMQNSFRTARTAYAYTYGHGVYCTFPCNKVYAHCNTLPLTVIVMKWGVGVGWCVLGDSNTIPTVCAPEWFKMRVYFVVTPLCTSPYSVGIADLVWIKWMISTQSGHLCSDCTAVENTVHWSVSILCYGVLVPPGDVLSLCLK